MKWNKLGRVYKPDSSISWARTHAYVPTVMLRGDEIRVFVAFWDRLQVKRIGYVDVSAKDPTKVLRVSAEPVLDVGEPGTFDCDGVFPSCVFHKGKEVWLYYVGWQNLVGPPFRGLYSGLAVSHDGGDTFNRYQDTPILDRIHDEKYVRSTSFVLRDNVFTKRPSYRVWYTSSNKLLDIHGHLVPSYNIKHAVSSDGVFYGLGVSCLHLNEQDGEIGISRPCVIKEHNLYKMFYSVRRMDKGYTIGYAESVDGYIWERKDESIGIEVSKGDWKWDSEMICFPCVVDYKEKRYMFYCGNDYGEAGFGVAVLEEG